VTGHEPDEFPNAHVLFALPPHSREFLRWFHLNPFGRIAVQMRFSWLAGFAVKIFVDSLRRDRLGSVHVAAQQPLPHRRIEPSHDA